MGRVCVSLSLLLPCVAKRKSCLFPSCANDAALGGILPFLTGFSGIIKAKNTLWQALLPRVGEWSCHERKMLDFWLQGVSRVKGSRPRFQASRKSLQQQNGGGGGQDPGGGLVGVVNSTLSTSQLERNV